MYTLDQLAAKLEIAVKENISRWEVQPPRGLYFPVSYAMTAGGKRLRPLLVLLGYQLFGDNPDEAIPAALAVEVFHNFTLLHDDIMDKAEMRRGLPTVHKKFSDNTAILSGDAMAFMAYDFLLQSRGERLRQLLTLFTATALEVCEGQQYDMDFENRPDVTTDEYINMIRLKTAVLVGCALKAGALASSASDAEADVMYDIGINTGLAFQLQDDLLDTFGDESTFGKKIGGDIVSNKKTYMLIKALELAGEEQKATLLDWLHRKKFNPAEKINAIKGIFSDLGIKEITGNLIVSYTVKAVDLLDNLAVAPERKTQIGDLLARLVTRTN
jgi:geranylgeranyl diphosphate synthase, type II